ncbi:MAG: glycosyltransferase [Phycisphaerales bacterium JB039]
MQVHEGKGFPDDAAAEASSIRRIGAVIPCYNRPADLARLLADLTRLELAAGIQLRVLVVDNASTPPLRADGAGLACEVIRLERNVGGSGGFNAGMGRTLADRWAEAIWLIDSDARVEAGALAGLAAALGRSDVAVAGSALADPESGEIFELGGFVDRRTGELIQPLPEARAGRVGPDGIREVDYVAACSMLVRREAIAASGLMADLFVSSDDAEWCLRIARRTGGKVVAVAGAVARHPDPDKMRTWARYDVARNCLVGCEALGLGRRARARRVSREVARAMAQTLVGRNDLAELHLRGLEDCASGRIGAAAREGRIEFERARPLSQLKGAVEALRQRGGGMALSSELRRLPHIVRAALGAAGVDVEQAPRSDDSAGRAIVALFGGIMSRSAIASARARPGDWMLGREMILVAEDGFVLRRLSGLRPLGACLACAARGARLAAVLALRGPGAAAHVPPAPLAEGRAIGLHLSIIILAYKRREALLATIARLRAGRWSAGAEIIVVDNASGDGSARAVRDQFPEICVIEMETNAGVAGFNRGAAQAPGDVLLILDDDSWPDDDALGRALALLEERADVAAVSLLPRHPQTLRPEWPFACVLGGAARDDWPVMGCGNLVRREAWQRVGGYEERFFLYRNDVDLALKLLGAGDKVWFDPSWVVWHDSPAAARKSLRWFELGMRNWVWLARRHGRGVWKWIGIALGWANAHRLAGGSARAHAAALRGAWKGLAGKPGRVTADGSAWRTLLRARRGH